MLAAQLIACRFKIAGQPASMPVAPAIDTSKICDCYNSKGGRS